MGMLALNFYGQGLSGNLDLFPGGPLHRVLQRDGKFTLRGNLTYPCLKTTMRNRSASNHGRAVVEDDATATKNYYQHHQPRCRVDSKDNTQGSISGIVYEYDV